jgi:hypothetical protein
MMAPQSITVQIIWTKRISGCFRRIYAF